jgi:CRISPR-associated endoribonuclease Cas6
MERATSLTAPTKLYAFLLKLRPLQGGTLMPFTGSQVHGAFLNWLRTAAPEVGTWLHEGSKRRLFTCSSLQFPLLPHRLLEAERRNVHLPLDPEKTYTVRFTLLLGELFPLFYEALIRSHTISSGSNKSPFIQIGKQLFLLEEVLVEKNDPSGWVGFTSLSGLVEQVKTRRLGSSEPLTLEFASLTTFNLSNSRTRPYGPHYALLPLPLHVFSNVMRRWEDLAQPEPVGIVQRDRIEQYLQDDGIIIVDYDLKVHSVHFPTHQQQGFVGRCTYALRGPDEPATPETPLTVRQQILLLAQLAFYCGVGYKTAMGMGQTRLV